MLFNKSTDDLTVQSPFKYYYVATFLIILFTAIAYFLVSFFLTEQDIVTEIQKPLVQLEAVNYEKDRNFEQAGIAYEKNAILATNKDEQAHYLVRSGNAYNRSGDYKLGFSILKSVEENPELSPEIRAEARLRMLQPYYVARLKEPLQIVFSDDRYSYALQGGSSQNLQDLELALRVSLEEIYQVIPTSYIDSLIAISYSAQALSNQDLSLTNKEELIAKTIEIINRGDLLSENEKVGIEDYWNRPEPQDFAKDMWFSGQHMKFVALTFLSLIDNSLVSKVEGSYAELLPYYEGNRSLSRLGQQFWTNFYYAAFLAEIYGESESTKIANLVKPFYETTGNYGQINMDEKGFWFFLRTELTRPESEQSNNTRFIYKIATLVPEFDTFIKTNFLTAENI